MAAARPNKAANLDSYSGRFAARLRELRLKAKLSIEELSEKTGIPDKTLYRWEAAASVPPLDTIPLLAEALKLKNARLIFPEK